MAAAIFRSLTIRSFFGFSRNNGLEIPLRTASTLTQDNSHMRVQVRRVKIRKRSMPYWAKKRNMFIENHLTASNKAFIDEVAIDMDEEMESKSPLKETAWPRGEWNSRTIRTGVIARKIGIYPMWTKDGRRLLTTLLQVLDNHVIDYIPPEQYAKTLIGEKYKGRFGSLIVGAERRNPKIFTPDYCDLFDKAGVTPKAKLSRFLVTPNAAIQPGTPLYATHFKVGDYVDVRGISIDRGFHGVVKRWEFKGGPKSHGTTKFHRRPGTIGTGRNMRVWRGKKMPGHTGSQKRFINGLKIWRINTKYNVIWVQGPGVPGGVHSFVTIIDSKLPTRKRQTPPSFPTHYPEETEPLPEDIYDKDLHDFSQPTITYENEPEITVQKPVKAGSKAQKRAR